MSHSACLTRIPCRTSLAPSQAREAHAEARASVLQRRSMVAAATSSASQAALAEGVAWAAAVAEALQAHLAALREASAGSPLLQRHAGCQRTLAALEALLSAAGLQVGRSATHQGPRNPPAALTATVSPDPAIGVTTGAYGSEFSPLSTPNAASVAQPSSLSLGVAAPQHEVTSATTAPAPASSFRMSPLAGDHAPQAAPSQALPSADAASKRGDTRLRTPAASRSSLADTSSAAAAASPDQPGTGDGTTRPFPAQAASHTTTPPKPPVIPAPNPFQSPPASAVRSMAKSSPTSRVSAAASGRRVRFRSDPRALAAAARGPIGLAGSALAPPRLPDLSLYVSPPSPDVAHGAAAAWLARRRLLGIHA